MARGVAVFDHEIFIEIQHPHPNPTADVLRPRSRELGTDLDIQQVLPSFSSPHRSP